MLEYQEPRGSAQRSAPLRASLQAALLGFRELPLPRLRWLDPGGWSASVDEEAALTAAAAGTAGAAGAAEGLAFEPDPSGASSGAPLWAPPAGAGGGGAGKGRSLREEPTLSARLPQPDVVQEAMERILRRRQDYNKGMCSIEFLHGKRLLLLSQPDVVRVAMERTLRRKQVDRECDFVVSMLESVFPCR